MAPPEISHVQLFIKFLDKGGDESMAAERRRVMCRALVDHIFTNPAFLKVVCAPDGNKQRNAHVIWTYQDDTDEFQGDAAVYIIVTHIACNEQGWMSKSTDWRHNVRSIVTMNITFAMIMLASGVVTQAAVRSKRGIKRVGDDWERRFWRLYVKDQAAAWAYVRKVLLPLMRVVGRAYDAFSTSNSISVGPSLIQGGTSVSSANPNTSNSATAGTHPSTSNSSTSSASMSMPTAAQSVPGSGANGSVSPINQPKKSQQGRKMKAQPKRGRTPMQAHAAPAAPLEAAAFPVARFIFVPPPVPPSSAVSQQSEPLIVDGQPLFRGPLSVGPSDAPLLPLTAPNSVPVPTPFNNPSATPRPPRRSKKHGKGARNSCPAPDPNVDEGDSAFLTAHPASTITEAPSRDNFVSGLLASVQNQSQVAAPVPSGPDNSLSAMFSLISLEKLPPKSLGHKRDHSHSQVYFMDSLDEFSGEGRGLSRKKARREHADSGDAPEARYPPRTSPSTPPTPSTPPRAAQVREFDGVLTSDSPRSQRPVKRVRTKSYKARLSDPDMAALDLAHPAADSNGRDQPLLGAAIPLSPGNISPIVNRGTSMAPIPSSRVSPSSSLPFERLVTCLENSIAADSDILDSQSGARVEYSDRVQHLLDTLVACVPRDNTPPPDIASDLDDYEDEDTFDFGLFGDETDDFDVEMLENIGR